MFQFYFMFTGWYLSFVRLSQGQKNVEKSVKTKKKRLKSGKVSEKQDLTNKISP